MLTTHAPNQPELLTFAERKRLEQISGIVFDIQRYSLHDGPGLRTNVFLKGCPLRCGWCSNPESQRMQPELALSAHNCMRCGQFDPACPDCFPEDRRHGTPRDINGKYDQRVVACPTGAIHWIGRRRTAGEVMDEVLRDRPFYQDGGGMTLTGGEATAQPDMAEALLRLAQAEQIATALETCGHSPWRVFGRLLPYLDDILFDLKHVDCDLQKVHTGLGNERILANLRRLVRVRAPVTIRIPLIPGFNATPHSVGSMIDMIRALPGSVKGIDLLPYHALGKSKYAALGRDYPWEAHDRLTDEEVNQLADIARASGRPVTVGG